MINEKALAEDLSWHGSKELKTQATTIKRLAGGLRSLDVRRLDLTDSEAKTIAAALVLVDRAANVYAKASKVKVAKEKRQAELDAEAIKLVRASEFGRLTAVDDIVAFIATQTPYMLERRDINNLWQARYLIETTYRDGLEQVLPAMLARQSVQSMPDKLAAAWAKFRELAPELKLRHAGIIQLVRNHLEADAKAGGQAVNSV